MPEQGESWERPGWWERRWLLILLVLLAAVPMLRPEIPPLLDLPSHVGRYRIQMDYAHWSIFRRYYTMEWLPIGNLGIDLLVFPLTPLIGLEPAVKWIMTAVPPLTVAGFLWTAKEAHGRVPPTALFALPLAYNFPLHFGFMNYSLALALAFPAIALWLRLTRLGRWRLRAALFVPLSLLLWLVHTFGWAVLCVVAFGAEFVRRREAGDEFKRAALHAALGCLCLAPPLVLMLLWRTSNATHGSVTDGFFNPITKTNYLATLLRDRWRWFDLLSEALLAAVFVVALRRWRTAFVPSLAAGVVLLAICYLLLPARMFDSSYADARLLPYALALTLIAIRPINLSARQLSQVAAIGLAFVLVRTAGSTASYWLYAQEFERELPAIAHLPEGARVVSFVGTPCRGGDWAMRRLDHLPWLAIARRRVFSNDQWVAAGVQMVVPNYPEAGDYAANPSQIVRIVPKCSSGQWRTLDESLAQFPRNRFDYVWLIRPPKFDTRLVQGLAPVWTNGDSVLYRIADHGQLRSRSEPPTPAPPRPAPSASGSPCRSDRAKCAAPATPPPASKAPPPAAAPPQLAGSRA